jgi:hypothetical protein
MVQDIGIVLYFFINKGYLLFLVIAMIITFYTLYLSALRGLVSTIFILRVKLLTNLE